MTKTKPLALECDFRSGCALASTLDLVGDRWSLLVLRMLMVGSQRYGELQAMPEGIASNILTDRLRMLEAHGIIARVKDGPRRTDVRYQLTPRGAALLPAMQALSAWGYKHLKDRWRPPAWFMAARPEDLLDPAFAKVRGKVKMPGPAGR